MNPIILPDGGLPEELSLPAHAVDETIADELPLLTEIVADDRKTDISASRGKPDDAIPIAPSTLNEAEVQCLLHVLENHLESLFTHKLSLSLEQLQRQAVAQAVTELKAELPELLRVALNAHS